MKTLKLFAVLTVFLLMHEIAFADGWIQKASMNLDKQQAVSFTIGNKGYLCTGNNSQDLWEYDPTTNAWLQKASLPGPGRKGAVGFSIGLYGYVTTGADNTGNLLNDLWEYNQNTNSWTQKANFPGLAREDATGFSVNGKGYVCMGDAGPNMDDLWEYDPSGDVWVQKANYPNGPGARGTAFVLDSLAYVGTTGYTAYDPVMNVWIPKAVIPGGPGTYMVSFSINDKGYVGTGWSSPNTLNTFFEYDPQVDTWTQKPNFLGQSRYMAMGFAIGNHGYIVGGQNQTGQGLADLWEYTPDTVITTGLHAFASPVISAYPNPAADFAIMSGTGQGEHYVILQDMTGRIVQDFRASGQIRIERGNLPAGIYIASITNDAGEHSEIRIVFE